MLAEPQGRWQQVVNATYTSWLGFFFFLRMAVETSFSYKVKVSVLLQLRIEEQAMIVPF